MKKILLFCLGLIMIFNSNAQTVIYTQNFETAPAGWIHASDNLGLGFIQGTYTARSSTNFPIPAPASGTGVIAVNDEQCACTSDDAIFSQNMNVTGYDSIRVYFKSFLRKVGTEPSYLLINNLGTHGTWADYDAYALPTSTTAWNSLYITIPAAELTANFHIGFYYTDGGLAARGLAIDDVQIIGYSAPTNDNCGTATPLTPSATCTPVMGTIGGASASGQPAACTTGANPSTDVWYSFQATSESVSILAQSSLATTANGFDMVFELYRGTCSGLTLVACADEDDITQTGATGLESLNIGDLTIGSTYYLRVYNYFGNTAVDGTFQVCVETIPTCNLTQPAGSIAENETCGATTNSSCATGMNISCGDVIWGSYSASAGTRDLDYYKFTITNPTTVNITLESEFPGAVILYNAANCSSLTALTGQYIDACTATTVTHNIAAAGTYAILVIPNSFYSPSCTGTKNNYILSYTANTTAPVISAGGATNFCSGGSVQLTTTGTGTIQWYNGSTLISGATAATYTATTSGSYTSVVRDGNGCPATSNAITVTATSLDNAAFNYASSTICEGSANVTPASVATAGGTFSSTSGLVFANTTTGEIDVVGSTSGAYTITYTTAGTCPSSSTQNITITGAPDATFSYAQTGYCSTGTNPSPVLTGSAGTFTASPAGLSINATTGVINLAASAAGTYDVTNTIAASGACPAADETVQVTITTASTAAFTYPASTYCLSAANPSPAITGTAGTFTVAPAGLTVNGTTGVVDLTTSAAGTYTVTNTVAASGACPTVTTDAQITITANPDASFSYAETNYCATGTASPAITGTAGAFTSTTGLTINGSTGIIDLAASTVGTYTITNTIAATATCGSAIETTTVTIDAIPTAAVTVSGATITATETTGVTYQWINCAGNTPIAGETAQSFTATANGNYAVIVSNGDCSTTSACQAISGLGIADNSIELITVYPNPTENTITISGLTAAQAVITVVDVNGRLLISEVTSGTALELSVRDFEAGVYFIQVASESINGTKRFIKK